MNHSDTLSLSLELLQQPSVTPIDHTCQTIMAERLAKVGFHIEPMRFGDVDNLWARRGTEGPVFCFAGHTDVVPTGRLDAWNSDSICTRNSRRQIIWSWFSRYENCISCNGSCI